MFAWIRCNSGLGVKANDWSQATPTQGYAASTLGGWEPIVPDSSQRTDVLSSRAAKNVTKSNAVLPRVCGIRFFKDSVGVALRDKNGRFGRLSLLLKT